MTGFRQRRIRSCRQASVFVPAGFEISGDDPGRRVCFQHIQAHEGRDPAHRIRQIVAARADGMRNPAAGLVDQAGELLDAGAGRPDHAHRPAADPVGEADPHAADQAGAAVRAHHQPAAGAGQLLELHFLLQGDIVAEEENMLALLQRLARFPGGVGPGHRDHHQVGLRMSAQRQPRSTGRWRLFLTS